jgi:protein gp37
MNKTKIEWADFTINPMVGCKHDCWYCYAKKLNDRFHFIENWNEPETFPERLDFKTPKIPKNRNYIAAVISPYKPIVFIDSMTDLFGSWVNREWLKMLIDIVADKPDITFMSLTKSPANALEFSFPENWIFGVTIEGDNKAVFGKRKLILNKINCDHTFISAEPLLGPYFNDFSKPDQFTIVGSMTGPGAVKPQKEWINFLVGEVYLKSSLLDHFDKDFWINYLSTVHHPEIYINELLKKFGNKNIKN